MTVYVVIGSVGEYSDRREWVVAVLCDTREQAQAWVDTASALSRSLWKYREDHRREDWVLEKDDVTLYGPDCAGPGRTSAELRERQRSAERWRTELDPKCDPTELEPTTYTLDAVEITDLDQSASAGT